MKLSEVEELLKNLDREATQEKRKALGEILSKAQGITNVLDKRMKDDLIYKVTTALKGSIDFIGIYDYECDNCATQLVNPYPKVCLTSDPVKYHAACVGCGYHGFTKVKHSK